MACGHRRLFAGSLGANPACTTGLNTHANMQYTLMDYDFTALGSSTTLAFNRLDQGDYYGSVIGGVSVNEVPESASLAVFGAGLAGIALIRACKP